ncbi:Glu/Leu/Phe/Val dehydrogenase [Alteromonas sediminis]|uniref:Glu/Leu/Phe/Val dehydrogenase n=1 Tax=Alteromonas sediminis TaxID=2259342 RepID=A0A3N5XX44_9ALTE|nr:Glu/Leu/Phe/Val dehydrogenase dimerization domain-containing protein [Alteromonas sediminis]RPJ65050.1 Glu/Leu/Phe/Val dehydrogenase [Alteromonas sediminis]
MALFEHPEFDNHEHVSFYHDKDAGLKAIIAVHNTNLGPALGGCRMWPYANSEEALTDVLRLSKGMTYKAAMAEVPLGGGKSVIIGNPRADKSMNMMKAMGRFVDTFGGAYYTAEDSGISVQDLQYMAEESQYIAGTQAKYHVRGEVADGNPAPSTAYGTFVGLKAAVESKLKSDLQGVRVAIQGVGHVGLRLARHLHEAGAELVVSDIFPENVEQAEKQFNAKVVSPDQILSADVDVVAPCAMGAIINEKTLAEMKARVIAGAANNQLSEERIGKLCQQAGILYAPDYVLNAGGIIDIHHQRMESSDDALRSHIEKIGDTLTAIFNRSDREQQATNIVANNMAEERFSK